MVNLLKFSRAHLESGPGPDNRPSLPGEKSLGEKE